VGLSDYTPPRVVTPIPTSSLTVSPGKRFIRIRRTG
jgi:hypothetical protein